MCEINHYELKQNSLVFKKKNYSSRNFDIKHVLHPRNFMSVCATLCVFLFSTHCNFPQFSSTLPNFHNMHTLSHILRENFRFERESGCARIQLNHRISLHRVVEVIRREIKVLRSWISESVTVIVIWINKLSHGIKLKISPVLFEDQKEWAKYKWNEWNSMLLDTIRLDNQVTTWHNVVDSQIDVWLSCRSSAQLQHQFYQWIHTILD